MFREVGGREKSDNIHCCDSGITGKLPETAKIHNQSGHKFQMTQKKNSMDRRFAGHILHRCAGRENLDPAARADSGEPS